MEQHKFRKCADTGFCKRQRDFNSDSQPSKWSVLPGSIRFDSRKIHGILSNLGDDENKLEFTLTSYKDATFRWKVKEVKPVRERWEVPLVVLEDDLKKAETDYVSSEAAGKTLITVGATLVTISHSPFRIDLAGVAGPALSVNCKGQLFWERARVKGEQRENDTVTESAGEEQFGTHTDKKPYGPSSIGVDFAFVGAANVYGIPERATSLALKPTKGTGIEGEPYRLYTLDIFEYELNNNIGLYGVIPLMISHDAEKTAAVFWVNSAEMFVDVLSDEKCSAGEEQACSERSQINTHWFSESGIIDVFFMLGPTPHDVFRQYARITGTQFLPQYFSIAYHQCRWNYRDQEDVAAVDKAFDEYDIPYDVIWLDIEHTDGKKYFTWDYTKFPDPIKMQNEIAAKGRKMVTIIDPHIKRETGYFLHNQAQNKHYIRNDDGTDYEGWCWPGSSSYLDFLDEKVRAFWASKFALEEYVGSTINLYTWNDMNEPTQFNGPEVQVHKDSVHLSGVEHREVHNTYGFFQTVATYDGHILRGQGNDRPFILTRSFFAGNQRYAAVWNGDNQADFKHLAATNAMLMTMNMAGLVFVGADVGGFFGNPSAELMVRWYQAGAFYPFFRAHAHLETKRREPWLFGDPYTDYIRKAIQTRYSLLPYWYTQFFKAHISNEPIMRALWIDYPKDSMTFTMEEQFLVGPSILVRPVTAEGVTTAAVYLPGDQPWYELVSNKVHTPSQTIQVSAPLDFIPVFIKGGSIIPKRERQRRCSASSKLDPYTLLIALDSKQQALGDLYVDDGQSFQYRKGEYIWRQFEFKNRTLTSKTHLLDPQDLPFAEQNGSYDPGTVVERVLVLGLTPPAKKISLRVEGSKEEQDLEFRYADAEGKVIIRKPWAPVAKNWSISFQ